jgi:YD repeat-containing protein
MHRATTPATGSGEIRYRYGVHGGMTLVPPSVSHVALTEIFDPLDTTTPAMRIYYSDGQGILPSRVNRVSVRASSGYVDYNYFISGDRGAYRDPANAVFASHYDLDGRLDRVIDPVGRATASTFDGAGRVIETRTYEHPNRNAYVARTTFAYDDRSNPIQEIVHPRINPATGLPFANPPLVTSREFHVVWNRPIRIIDPRGSESTITYHPTTGLVLSEAGPSGEVVTYQHNSFGQVTRVEVEAGQ